MSRCGIFTGHGDTRPLVGPDGKRMSHRFLMWRVPLFEFQNDPVDPLTYHRLGTAYQPDRHAFQYDGGSIPPFLWGVPGLNPFAFPRAYPFHDCGFTLGGLYVLRPDDVVFTFALMTRDQLNALLREMIAADGGSWWDQSRISGGVRLGSRWCWDPEAQAKARAAAGIVL